MSLNGSGVFVVNSSGQPVVATTLIEASVFNAFTADVATALSTALYKDGQQTVTANIPMGGFKFTGLAAGTAAGNSLRYEQLYTAVVANIPMAGFKLTGLGAGSAAGESVRYEQLTSAGQDGGMTYLTSVAGTNTITATATPTPVYAIGQRFTGIAAATNTGAVTLNISSVGAGAVQWQGAALTGGELVIGMPFTVLVTAATPVFQIISPMWGVPGNSQNAGYTLVLADTGKCIKMATAGTFTIPANSSVAYPPGTIISFFNGTTVSTIPITTDTMTLAGTATTGTRTLAANGFATAYKLTTTTWVISGTGLT